MKLLMLNVFSVINKYVIFYSNKHFVLFAIFSIIEIA